MIQLRAYRDTTVTFLDLFKDEPIELEMSFAEIQDITSKNGSYTKSFNLPGSKTNNLFFEHYYNPQTVGLDFDSRNRIEADIVYNGYEILNGYIRLEDTVRTGDEVFYNVTFYNETGNLLSKIGDKRLSDLDTSTYFDHVTNWGAISQSWNINPSTGVSGLLGGNILYPLLNRGYRYNETPTDPKELDFEQTGIFNASGLDIKSNTRFEYEPVDWAQRGKIRNEYFPVSVQVKALFECICENAGFRIESDFFDNNEWFQRLYMPLTYGSEDYGFQTIPNQTFTTSNLNGVIFTSGSPVWTYNYENLIEDTDGLWTSTTQFTNSESGYHQFVIEFDYDNQTSNPREMRFEVLTNPGSLSWQTVNFTFEPTTQSNLQFTVWLPSPSAGQSNSLVFRTLSGGSNSVTMTNINFRQLKSSRYRENLLVDVSKEFGDDALQVDYISSVLKHFNLVLVPKPNDTKTLLIEPVGNYIGRGNRLDWSQKVDRSEPFRVTSTNKFINGVVNFEPLEGKDYLNEQWKKGNNPAFGSRQLELNTDFRKQELSIPTKITVPQSELFRPTVDYTFPVYYQAKDENINGVNTRIFTSFKTTPTFLYYSGRRNINFDRGVYMNYEGAYQGTVTRGDTQYFPQSHHLTYFPVATATQNKTLGFNKDQKQGNYKNIEIHDDCYTLFYEEMLNDYLGRDARFVECSVYLTPEEIKEIDFREIITIDNVDYRINKIGDFNLVQGNVAKVELLKVYQDYTTFGQEGTDKIRLNACGAGIDDIYTTMELSQGIVLFTGSIIKVNGNCYFVDPPTAYDPNLTYVTVVPDNVNGVPFVYQTCTDCGQSGGDVCEPIVDIETNYNPNIPSTAILLATFWRTDAPGSQFQECIRTDFYWDCDTNQFLEIEDVLGQGSCPFPDGWANEYGTPMTIPVVGRPGYLVQGEPDDCCFDPNTGFNYEIYWEKDDTSGYPIAYLHKICCDEQPADEPVDPTTTTTTTIGDSGDGPVDPTTTTTTTIAQGGVYLIRECDGGTSTTVVTSQTTLFGGDIVYISGSANVNKCWEVLDLSNQPPVETVLQVYIDCPTCLQANGGVEETTTTTTEAPFSYYYNIKNCDTDFVYQVGTNTPLSFSLVYHLELDNGADGCYTILSTASSYNVTIDFNNNDYDNCNTCLNDYGGGGGSSE